MLGEFLARLAIALPLVCGLAVLLLWAARRGRLRLPGLAGGGRTPGAEPLLEILELRAVSPAARLAVIRFDGRVHLVGVTGQTMSLLVPTQQAERAMTAASE
jgi:flagellar biogenesis protein FliO